MIKMSICANESPFQKNRGRMWPLGRMKGYDMIQQLGMLQYILTHTEKVHRMVAKKKGKRGYRMYAVV